MSTSDGRHRHRSGHTALRQRPSTRWRASCKPVITLEHVTRLTNAAAPEWEYPPDGHTGVHRVIVDGEPRLEINTHVSHPVLDSTDAGCVSTAGRVVNAIDWVCDAPAGLVAVDDVPLSATMRGLAWA